MGNAISDVLYGDINPSGRLALTFPNKENEVGFTTAQWPGMSMSLVPPYSPHTVC